jgi:pre-mRNA-processing factor SLU7
MAAGDRKAKIELDAARMRGELPPEVDAAGNLINPHIPEFMAKAPWYAGAGGSAAAAAPVGALDHQRLKKDALADESIAALEGGAAAPPRRSGGVASAPAATRFRKGACRNCGAVTHSERDCTDRPRKIGAWKTGSNIARDELLPSSASLGWDAKRDR